MDERTKKEFIENMRRTLEIYEGLGMTVKNHSYDSLDNYADVNNDFEELDSDGIPMTSVSAPNVIDDKSDVGNGWPAVCSGCGVKTRVPFEPKFNSPVYCADCFKTRGGRR